MAQGDAIRQSAKRDCPPPPKSGTPRQAINAATGLHILDTPLRVDGYITDGSALVCLLRALDEIGVIDDCTDFAPHDK